MRKFFTQLLVMAVVLGCAVDLPKPPIAVFEVSNGGCQAPCSVTFISKSENAKSIEWDFDDGSPIYRGANPVHEYKDGRDYYVKMIAVGTEGASHGVTHKVIVKPIPKAEAVADFEFALSNDAIAPSNATFTNRSRNSVAYKWEFKNPDGSVAGTSEEQNPTFKFDKPGKYQAILVAYNSEGKASAPATKTVEVQAAEVVADFTVTGGDCEAPCEVTFTNTSKNATEYQWDFGDKKEGSTDTSPKYTFTKSGVYTVTLTAKGNGQQKTKKEIVTIRAKAVNAIKIGSELNFPNDLIADANGNIYVCGVTKGPTNFGNGKEITFSYTSNDFFVAKYNSSGECQWAYVQGGPGNDVASALALDNENNLYVTGAVSGMPRVNDVTPQGGRDGFVLKLNGATGQSMWFTLFGGPRDDSGRAVGFYQTPGGPRVYLAADITGDGRSVDIDFFNGTKTYAIDQDICFVFLDANNGQIKQPTVIRASGPQSVGGMDVDLQGNAYLIGSFEQQVNFGGATSRPIGTWAKLDVFVAKWVLNPGHFVWANRIGWFEDDFGKDVAVDDEGNVFVTGVVQGQSADLVNNTSQNNSAPDVFVAKLSSSGIINWGLTGFNSYLEDFAGGLALLPDGKLLVTGSMHTSGNFPLSTNPSYATNGRSLDMIVAEIDGSNGSSTGNFVKTGGGTNEDKGYAVCTTPDGMVYVAGYFTGEGSFNGVDLIGNRNMPNTFIVKYKR